MAERTERNVLEHLIEICRDGERGFHLAADHVSDPAIKVLFLKFANQRRRFAVDLVPHLQRLGGRPDVNGTGTGTLHRVWMELKDRVAGNHDHMIIKETERGEHIALMAYQEALNGMLPPTVTDLIEKQRDEIQEAAERIRAIELTPQ